MRTSTRCMHRRPAPCACASAALALFLAGCAPRGEEHARIVEREETRGGERFLLRSEIRPARATLGDPVEWTLLADVPNRTSSVDLRAAATDPALEIMALAPAVPSRPKDREVWRFQRRVRAFDLGPRALPTVVALIYRGTYADTLEFPNDTLFVDSLTAGPRQAIDPDHGPLPTELRPIDIAVAATATVLVAALVIFIAQALFTRRARPAAKAAVRPDPPAAVYRRALAALRAETGALRRDEFYDRLAAAVRVYVEGATGIPAPERTTREISEELALHAHITAETRATLMRTLRRADLVKFARVTDETAEALAALSEAARLEGKLESPAAPVAPPSAAQDAG